MKLANSSERWGAVSQLLHWLIVALVLTQVTLAYLAADLPLGLQKLALLARHKSFGITILGLALIRLAWRLASPGPKVPMNLRPLERLLARATHAGLYTCLFLMPLSGWLMSSAKKYSVSWFGFVQLPDLVAPSDSLFQFMRTTHKCLAYTLAALALLHIAGALRHQFVLKDNLMKRMLPCTCLSLALLLMSSQRLRAEEWTTDAAHSKLTFSFTQAGAINTGKFDKFGVVLHADAETLSGGNLVVTVDVASIDTGDGDRDTALRGADLFDAARIPTGRFASSRIDQKSADRYEASGTLTLRGVSRPVRLPLATRRMVEAGKPVLYLTGKATIKRLDFGIGQGELQSTEWVGNDVPISWSVRLIHH